MFHAARLSLQVSLGLILMLSSETFAAGSPSKLDELTDERSAMADKLLGPIADCVERHDTDAPLFHGCSDWSSAVQGYWAMAALARVTGRDDLLAAVKEQLTPE